jgi:hypothetical protein
MGFARLLMVVVDFDGFDDIIFIIVFFSCHS